MNIKIIIVLLILGYCGLLFKLLYIFLIFSVLYLLIISYRNKELLKRKFLKIAYFLVLINLILLFFIANNAYKESLFEDLELNALFMEFTSPIKGRQ